MTANSTRPGSEPVVGGSGSSDILAVADRTGNGQVEVDNESTEEVKAAAVEVKDPAPVGSVSTVKNIYKSPKDADGNVGTPPPCPSFRRPCHCVLTYPA